MQSSLVHKSASAVAARVAARRGIAVRPRAPVIRLCRPLAFTENSSSSSTSDPWTTSKDAASNSGSDLQAPTTSKGGWRGYARGFGSRYRNNGRFSNQEGRSSNDRGSDTSNTNGGSDESRMEGNIRVQSEGDSNTNSALRSIEEDTRRNSDSSENAAPSPSSWSSESSSSNENKTAKAAATPNLEELSADERATVNLYRNASPSVVNVSSTISPPTNAMGFPFNMFAMPRGAGSGFVWTDTGVVVTNAHVVQNADDVRVTLWDSSTYKAKVIGKDREKDIAVLQLDMPRDEMSKLQALALGSSDSLLVGQKVYAIGNPFGLDQTLTQGIVSGLGREINSRFMGALPISNVIQTDAAINPGNSGGPLLDSKGRVVGINTAILDPTGTGISSGVGFAIPINAVRGMVDQLLRFGRVIRPTMGISLAPPTFLKSQGRQGVLVMGVRPDGPAAQAGIQGTRREGWGNMVLGDVIVGINGRRVREQKDLFAALDDTRVGDQVEVEVLRNGKSENRTTVRVRLEDRDRTNSYE